ncbi:unnamed protein product, partial [Hydatigera taeniaeformis]|uniref:Ras-GEF domain-containing protein n=1 Tax=Hydatigena taeniaeformis TaxID=6205 RepID=A0A0R3XCW6_HYDTA
LFSDTLSSDEALALPPPKLPTFPNPPSTCFQSRKSTTAVASRSPTTMDNEKRDRVIFQAVEIISEWLAAEPCFIDPEATYGDKNARFLDTVVQRLQNFKTTISWEVLKMLQDASNACRETRQSPTTTRLRSPLCTHTSFSKTDSTTAVPRRTPISGELSSRTHEGRASHSETPFHIDVLPRVSPVMVSEVPRRVFDGVLHHPCRYGMGLGKTPSVLFKRGGGGSDVVDMDASHWRRPSRRKLKMEMEVEGDLDDFLTSGTLRHPIWDTPDECKTYYSNILMLE